MWNYSWMKTNPCDGVLLSYASPLSWVTCKPILSKTAVSLGLWSGVIYRHSQDKLAALWSKGRRGGCQKKQSNVFPVLMRSARALTITDVVFPNNLYSCCMCFQLFLSRVPIDTPASWHLKGRKLNFYSLSQWTLNRSFGWRPKHLVETNT